MVAVIFKYIKSKLFAQALAKLYIRTTTCHCFKLFKLVIHVHRMTLSVFCFFFVVTLTRYSVALNVTNDEYVGPEDICPDGEVPLNSLHHRCHSTAMEIGAVAWPWPGQKCHNSTRPCPSSYICGPNGTCCDANKEIAKMVKTIFADVCSKHLPTSELISMNKSCTMGSQCGYELNKTCCENKCYHWPNACGLMKENYLRLYQVGVFPGTHYPLCDKYGNFLPVQHDERTGMFWCVNKFTGLATNKDCCLPPPAKTSICPAGVKVQECPREMCSMEICVKYPKAVCKVNPCGDKCSVEFYEHGNKVDCSGTGLSKCEGEQQEYYQSLSRMHRYDQSMPWHSNSFDYMDSIREIAMSKLNSTFSQQQFDSTTPPPPPHRPIDPTSLFCSIPQCIHYNASKLEPNTAPAITNVNSCPRQLESTFFSKFDHCQTFANSSCNWYYNYPYNGCGPDKPACCYDGCIDECMKPEPKQNCLNAYISSGHCPYAGCNSMCKMWGYDRIKKTCRSFWYAGAGGNDNRFDTFDSCLQHTAGCHNQVLFPIPYLPECDGSKYYPYQILDFTTTEEFFGWCVDPATGTPTPGSLHSPYGTIGCSPTGQLINTTKWYNPTVSTDRWVKTTQITCLNGEKPQICPNIHTNDDTCQAPGIYTYVDFCNGCRKVYFNHDGIEVSCPKTEDICSGNPPCKAINTRYYYNKTTDRCQPQQAGIHNCTNTSYLDYHNAFSREDFCLHACTKQKCPGITSPMFYPDLCVKPSCEVQNASCVADQCVGKERYFLHGKEITKCERSIAPFELKPIQCRFNTTAMPTTKLTDKPVETKPTTTTTTMPTTKLTDKQDETKPTTTTSTTITEQTVTPTTTPKQSDIKPPPGVKPPTICKKQFEQNLLVICTSDGLFNPQQCNKTHCFCVVSDSGRIIPKSPISTSALTKLDCKLIKTTQITMDIRFEADFASVSTDKNDFIKSAQEQLTKQIFIDPKNLNIKQVASGSIIVTIELSKSVDSIVDLPSASDHLKNMTMSKKLILVYNGVKMQPAPVQNFQESFVLQDSAGRTLVEKHEAQAQSASSNSSATGAIAGGVVGSIAVIAIAVVVYFVLTKRNLNSHEEFNDTSSMGTRSEISGYSNQIYGVSTEDIYALPDPITTNA